MGRPHAFFVIGGGNDSSVGGTQGNPLNNVPLIATTLPAVKPRATPVTLVATRADGVPRSGVIDSGIV